jgi:hypothetical protein
MVDGNDMYVVAFTLVYMKLALFDHRGELCQAKRDFCSVVIF